MAREIIHRPNIPLNSQGKPMAWEAESGTGMYYLVTQEAQIVAAYQMYYFQSINEIVADLTELVRTDRIAGPWGEDYAVWYAGRMMAAIHQPLDSEHQRIVLFNDPRNFPGCLSDRSRWHGWPSRDQWIADGRGDIEFDPEKYPNHVL